MRQKFLLLFILSFTLNICPVPREKSNIPVETLNTLMENVHNFNSAEDNIWTLKQDLRSINRYGKSINNHKKVFLFFNQLLREKKFKDIHYFIYLQLAKRTKNKKRSYLRKALQLSLNDESRLEVLVKLYEYHKWKGDTESEIFYLKKQVNIRKKSGNRKGLQKTYTAIGDYYLLENNLIRSLQNFFEALKYSERTINAKNGYIYEKIAIVFSSLGRNKLALKYLKKALDCSTKFRTDTLRRSVLNDFGKIYFSIGDYKNADYYNNLSLKISEKKNLPVLKLNSDYLKARIYFKTGKEIEGLSLLKTAVDNGIRSESYIDLLPVLYEFIRKAILYGNLEIASSYLQWLDEIYAPYHRGYFLYYFLKAVISEKKGDLGNAGKFFDRTVNNLEKFFSGLKNLKYYPFKKEITYIYSIIARFNFRMFDLTNDVKFLKKAIYAGEVKNPYMFRLSHKKTKQSLNISIERNRIKNEISSTKNRLTSVENNSNEKTFFKNRLSKLRTQLVEMDDLLIEVPKNYSRYRISDLDISGIQKTLAKDTVIIRFLILEKNAYAFVIDNKSIGYKKLERSSKYIRELTNTLINPIEDYAEGSVDFLRIKYDLKKSQELYNIILFEILEFQKDKKKLIIIPDNVLFKIPFEALATDIGNITRSSGIIFSEYENARFLIDNYSVEYVLSLFHLHKKKKSGKNIYNLAAFGFPEIISKNKDSRDYFGFPDSGLLSLPSSGIEINKIKKIWGKNRNRYFTGTGFTKENFIRIAPESRIVHIATHFVSNEEYPWYSFFLFSPGKKGDAIYYVSEMSKLKLNCELMFLSTCKSSENHLMGEQLINGVTAALFNSGVRSIIASSWPVNEFSTGLITPFYTELMKDPEVSNDVSRLMRKIKISFKKKRIRLKSGQIVSFSHPLIWANFNLYRFNL